MWLLPLLAIGALVYLVKKQDRAPQYVPQYALPPAPMAAMPMMIAPPAPLAPTPMDMLCFCISNRRQPPPIVISCAIAQAEQMGRHDIAHDIICMFVAPVVLAHQQQRAPAPAPPRQAGPQPAPPPAAQPQPPPGAPPTSAPGPAAGGPLTDAQIQAMLNSDPARFISRVQRGQVIDVEPAAEPAPAPAASPAQTPAGATGSQDTVIGAVAQLPSPIRGVDALDWSTFCDKLARETPEFASSRHVGQYRQNTDRLLELGVDPDSLRGSPQRQREALDRDLADQYRHAVSEGIARTHIARRIRIPGHPEPVQITLSGVLGVIQAAGLEGADNWLHSSADRKRFVHTTQAFLRTNGVF